MAKNGRWVQPVFQGVVGNALYAFIVLLWGAGVTYFSLITPEWGAALLKGFLASVLLIIATVAWRIMVTLPPRTQATTTENIEERTKEWLFKHGLSIKNDPSAVTHFRFFIVTAGNTRIFIGRRNDLDGQSLSFTADLKASAEEKKIAEVMTDEEKLTVVYAMQLELARAVVSYKGLDYLQGFSITKMLPITPRLGETQLLDTLWEVEAVVSSLLTLINMAILRHSTRLEQEKAARQPQSD